jgi:FkbM family methyltransferase
MTIIKTAYYLLKFLDKFINIFSKKFQFLLLLKEFIEGKSYKSLNILNRKSFFFIPNKAVNLRVKRIFQKEPETIAWINSFKNTSDNIFWDIGANIGLFSIYCAIKNNKIKVYSFEPCFSNLRVLSRNISINNLQKNIAINPIALTNVENKFAMFLESRFQEGSSEHSIYNSPPPPPSENVNSYRIFCTNINYFLLNKIMKIPNYIKIDVDGIEHLILEGFGRFLKNKRIKSISIEVNEDLPQHRNIKKILLNSNFELVRPYLLQEENYRENNYKIKNLIFKKL